MSWSSSYPPPPRRSRSRSPRGSYPPRSAFPDSTYMGDTYRSSDWDNYDRERWSSYDRDRGLYEYGRRRSRSPPSDESESAAFRVALSGTQLFGLGRKRRRSVSPYERDRDRYDPRPRYSDDYGLAPFFDHGCPTHKLFFVNQTHIPVVTDMRRPPAEDPRVHIHPLDAPLQTHIHLNFLRH